MEERAVLVGTEEDREITRGSAPEFWREAQRLILLALKEEGVLSEAQYQCAQAVWRRRTQAADGHRQLPTGGEGR